MDEKQFKELEILSKNNLTISHKHNDLGIEDITDLEEFEY